jgi:TM2 domain-containing membrane protein YozV
MVSKAQIGRSHEISTDAMSWAAASTFPEVFERATLPSVDTAAAAGKSATLPPDGNPLESVGQDPGMAPSASTVWHYTLNGSQQPTPIDQQALIRLIVNGHVGPGDHVWNETMATWAKVSQVADLAAYALPMMPRGGSDAWSSGSANAFPPIQVTPQAGSSGQSSPEYRSFVGKKTGAGVAALLIGALGIHKFMLGLTTGGLTMLLLCILLVPIPFLSLIAFVEGILYLSKSEEQFFRDYALERKQWF